jgi:hypothetical protein
LTSDEIDVKYNIGNHDKLHRKIGEEIGCYGQKESDWLCRDERPG